jgi:hypothetical protein
MSDATRFAVRRTPMTWMGAMLIASLGAYGGTWISPAAGQATVSPPIRTSGVTVVDKDGAPRVVIGRLPSDPHPDTWGMQVTAPGTSAMATIGVRTGDQSVFSLRDKSGLERIRATVGGDGGSIVQLNDGAGPVRLRLRVSETGESEVQLLDGEMKIVRELSSRSSK